MNQFELIQVLKTLAPEALHVSGYTIAVDSSGNATIASWNATNAGIAQPTDAQLTATLASIQLAQAQQTQVAVLQSSYAASGYAPVSYMAASFPSDPDTLLLLSCTLIQGSTPQGLPSGFAWYSAAGTPVLMTLSELQSLGNAIFQQVYPAYVKLQGLIASVYAATSTAAVQQITW